jgi:Regulator of ribonuclease activity B
MKAPELQWPDDADGDVLRRMKARGFNFGRPCLIDFNVEFDSWPPPAVALTMLERQFPSTKTYPSSDGGGYVQFQVYGRLTYELVVNTQRGVSEEMAKFGGVCDSWGVLH